jgi:hypothetical protein
VGDLQLVDTVEDVACYHQGPGGDEALGDGPALAPRRTGDDGHPSAQATAIGG